uniref:Uncharacterized protein n=1 Tax=Phasianus colchicus TaxID=9054 RepID=A0A669P8Q3_PHACC
MLEGKGNVVPEPIVCPTESKERTTESVTQEYKFIFPFSLVSFLAVIFFFCYFSLICPYASLHEETEELHQPANQSPDHVTCSIIAVGSM